MNPAPDDTCRTIKAQYGNTSISNMQRTGTFGTTGVVTYLIGGVNLKNQGKEAVRLTDISHTLMARDGKGLGNQEMTAVLEVEKNEQRTCLLKQQGGEEWQSRTATVPNI